MANERTSKESAVIIPAPPVNGKSEAPDESHRIELSRELAAVVRANMEQVNRQNAALEAAKSAAALAGENNARLITALVQQAGKNVSDFVTVNLVEDAATHKVFLYGLTPEQVQQMRGA